MARRLVQFLAAIAALWLPGLAHAELRCSALKDIMLPHAGVTGISTEALGPKDAKACKYSLVSHPTNDSDIRIEVWVPIGMAWNGKFVQVGNGGFAGQVPSGFLRTLAARGYAAAGTDNGHQANVPTDAAWALRHPEKVADYGWRSLKETTDLAKTMIRSQKGSDALQAYFVGCSDGGREALLEAQRFPQDFDGIVAGAPANDFARLSAGFAWSQQAQLNTPGAWLTPSALTTLQGAALRACGGGAWIADPAGCRFDPAVTLCRAGQDPAAACLTPAQVAAARAIYEGPRDARGRQIYPGYTPGAEAMPGGWPLWITGLSQDRAKGSLHYQFGSNFYRYLVFDDPDQELLNVNLGADLDRAQARTAAVVNSTNPNLAAFRARGGKLIHYHGWGDAAIPPRASIAYYEDVRRTMGDPSGFYRLYLIPGMLHCGDGPGPSNVDWLAVLEDWVERGVAPAELIATNAPQGGGPAPARPMTQRLTPWSVAAAVQPAPPTPKTPKKSPPRRRR